MWLGTWGLRVHSFTSNWKELCTLRQVLRREIRRDGGRRVRGRWLFYFTDNMVTYDIVRNGKSGSGPLQDLIREIKLLELQLDCRVEAVHVPGTTMIVQGTDGLSRGVWMDRLNYTDHDLPRALFRPAVPTRRCSSFGASTRFAVTTLPSGLAARDRPVALARVRPHRSPHLLVSLALGGPARLLRRRPCLGRVPPGQRAPLSWCPACSSGISAE